MHQIIISSALFFRLSYPVHQKSIFGNSLLVLFYYNPNIYTVYSNCFFFIPHVKISEARAKGQSHHSRDVEAGATRREIGTAIGKSLSTVSHELTRNKKRGRRYEASRAHRVSKRRLAIKAVRPWLSVGLWNGTEISKDERVNKNLRCNSYFCAPYHSWEKEAVENVNGLIRQYHKATNSFSQPHGGHQDSKKVEQEAEKGFMVGMSEGTIREMLCERKKNFDTVLLDNAETTITYDVVPF